MISLTNPLILLSLKKFCMSLVYSNYSNMNFPKFVHGKTFSLELTTVKKNDENIHPKTTTNQAKNDNFSRIKNPSLNLPAFRYR